MSFWKTESEEWYMASIELVIKIDIDDCHRIVNGFVNEDDAVLFAGVLKKAIQLPKGHGKLGDLDELKKEMQNYHDDCAKTSEYTRLGFETAMAVVENANTIIEADKSVSGRKDATEQNIGSFSNTDGTFIISAEEMVESEEV